MFVSTIAAYRDRPDVPCTRALRCGVPIRILDPGMRAWEPGPVQPLKAGCELPVPVPFTELLFASGHNHLSIVDHVLGATSCTLDQACVS